MSRFTSPLDNIRIASPCSSDWNRMFGTDRKRFCGDCKLNVYNLSDMSRDEAERLILNSEGRLCVRFFRRADGTILTKNCPVGWAAVKHRASRVATAVSSMIAGLFTGVLGFNLLSSPPQSRYQTMGAIAVQTGMPEPNYPIQGGISAVDDLDRGAMGKMMVGEIAVQPGQKQRPGQR
jgi:hypothetical protein